MSAKKLIDECSMTCLISSIYKINKSGTKMESWGTPGATGSQSENSRSVGLTTPNYLLYFVSLWSNPITAIWGHIILNIKVINCSIRMVDHSIKMVDCKHKWWSPNHHHIFQPWTFVVDIIYSAQIMHSSDLFAELGKL